MGTAIIVGLALLLTIGAGVGYYAVEEEYIPLALETEEPYKGKEVDITQYEKEYSDIISQIPNLENIQYDVFTSTASIIEVRNMYIRQLTERDYTHEEDLSGEFETSKGIDFEALVFTKGATAVVIALSHSRNFENIEGEVVILYTTGAIWDYQAILDWYQNEM